MDGSKDMKMTDSTNYPTVVISMDFEMRWGVHDVYGLNFDGYRKNLENCRDVVTATLQLLTERDLHATWATVGALGMDDWNDYFSFAPPPPSYAEPRFAVRHEYADMDPEGTLHFAPDLIRNIVKSEGQELGSHSFSHLYFQEPGIIIEDFLLDMFAVEKLWAERFGVTPVSLVFPRNQGAFLEQLDLTSIKISRGNESAWFYDCNTQSNNSLYPRLLRLADSVNPWTNRVSRLENKILRASMFIRFALPEPLWRLQIIRLKKELSNLSPGDISHLWWHPHNLGFDLKTGLCRLNEVLDVVAEACNYNSVVSMNMRDYLNPTL